MARYIDAVTCADIISEKLNISLGDLVDVFADVPTADVVEVKRGHWKHSEAPLGWQDVDVAVCSVCGEEWVLDEWDIKEFSQWNNFCPNCGADMRGDKSDNL